ncbi:RNA ligase family protein [Sphingobacterium sp. Lzh-3]|uniref:RNA ligase family protein n=1 Tax=Sphingobacterium sp. Lzh-3 TaxID=3382150 RepID=UPI00398D26B8
MSIFSGYEKMPDKIKKIGLSEKAMSQLGKIKWVVTEKVHGANFSFSYQLGELKFAKRREYLEWASDFFGYQLVVARLESNMMCLFERLSLSYPEAHYIVYGELFGGVYPHKEVAVVPHLQAIQTGVYYSPDIHFYAFDIAIIDKFGQKHYLDYQTSISYFEEFDLFYAKPLFIGKMNEALNFNLRMNSSIPGRLGLPELKDNLIEGVVIKPYDSEKMQLEQERPIIKLKNPEFNEQLKFHEAEKWSFIPDVSSKSENLSFLVAAMRTYVTQNRLNSVISKIGALDLSNVDRVRDLQSEFLADIFIDFNEQNQYILDDLTSEDREWIDERLKSDIDKEMQKARSSGL